MAMDISQLNSDSALSSLSLTEDRVQLERMVFASKMIIPPELHSSLKMSVDRDVCSNDMVVSLCALFMKKLVHSEPVAETKEESTETVSGTHPVPSRPVDHLIEFLVSICPISRLSDWLINKQQLASVDTEVCKLTTNKTTVNHYHVIPWDLNSRQGSTVTFVSWKGTHYEGTPEEWGDLKKIRQFILDAEERGDPYRAELLWYEVKRMARESKLGSQRHG